METKILHTTLTVQECRQRLESALAGGATISGQVEEDSFRLVKGRSSTTLEGQLTGVDSGTEIECRIVGKGEDQTSGADWKRMVMILIPLAAVSAIVLVLLEMTSPLEWALALGFPLLLIAVVYARQSLAKTLARGKDRELVHFLGTILEADRV